MQKLDIDYNKLIGRHIKLNYDNNIYEVKEVPNTSYCHYFTILGAEHTCNLLYLPNVPFCGYETSKDINPGCKFATTYTLDCVIKNGIIIHTETQNEYDYVSKILKSRNLIPAPKCWDFYGDKMALNIGGDSYGTESYYKAKGCQVISAVWFILDNLDLLNNKTQKEMKVTYTVTRKFIGEIYSKVCSDYKNEIVNYLELGENPFKEEFEISNAQLEKWIDIASTQHVKVYEILLEQFPEFKKKEIDLTDKTTINNLQLFKEDGNAGNSLIAIRGAGNFYGKGFYLNPHFKWEIKSDDLGSNCLVPTKQ